MSKNDTNTLFNANLYINGVNKLGQAEEVTTPHIKFKKVEQKTLGMIGTVSNPAGIEAMSAKIKFNSFYPEVLQLAANPYQSNDLTVRGNIQKYSNGSKIEDQAAVLYMSGTFDDIPMMGDLKPQEKTEFETSFDAHYAHLIVGGIDIFEIDILNNIWNVSGADILAQYRLNLGA